jgi:DNA-binding transcriptional MerR regulator
MTAISEHFEGSLDELVAAANHALAGVEAEDRRVAPAVDGRTVRWYTSSGLLPAAERDGRYARYDSRHLHRLVAIRRLQADGWALGSIQRLLDRVDDRQLLGLATGTDAPSPEAFWAARPAAPTADPTGIRHPAGTGTTVVLAPGVRLVLDQPLDVEQVAALQSAARPLLDALERPAPRPSRRTS